MQLFSSFLSTYILFIFFRYFEGYSPVLSVADPEIVKHVLVKDFQNFTHRKVRYQHIKTTCIVQVFFHILSATMPKTQNSAFFY
jgi:hypothetical protein